MMMLTRPHRWLLLVMLLSLCLSPLTAQAQAGNSQWSPPDTINATCCAAQTEPLVDPWGNLHLFWANEAGYIIYTAWDGTGWSAPVDIIRSPTARPAVHVRAAADQRGFLHLVWATTAGGPLYYSRAWVTDAGNPHAWAPPQLVAERSLGCDIQVAPDGRVHLVYSEIVDAEGPRHITLSENYEWSQPTAVETDLANGFTVGDVRMAIGADGVLHLVWGSYRMPGAYPEHAVYYQRSTDGGVTWSAPYDPDPLPPDVEADLTSNYKNKMPNVAVGEQGDVHITWHRYTGYRQHRWSRDGGLTWSQTESVFPDMGPAFNGPVDMAFDSTGRMHVVATRSAIWYRTWTEAQGWLPPALVDANTPDWHHHRVAVYRGNQVFLFYPDINGTGFMWYTHKTVDAPQIEPVSLPERPAVTSAQGNPGASGPIGASPPAGSAASEVAPYAPVRSVAPLSTELIMLASILPAALLVGAVVVAQVVRRGKRQ